MRALVLALGIVPLAAAAGPLPQRPVTAFLVELHSGSTTEQVAWRAPESFAVRTIRGQSRLGYRAIVEGGGTTYLGGDAIERRTYAARPDGFSYARLVLAAGWDFVLGQARSGKLRLAATRTSGRPALRATYRVYQNDCAGLRGGSARLWLDRATLLPLRLEVRRADLLSDARVAVRVLNGALPGRTFAAPRPSARPRRIDYGFVRSTPAAAARRLSYRPQLPESVPAGFSLSVSGWARRSGRTGAEGSNPRYRHLFGAVYRRGFERIDVTQRLAGRTGWIGDPFGLECGRQFESRVRIRGVAATFATGPDTTPHLYWRRGNVLFTVSGPLARRDLLAIASSLAPIAE